MEIIILIMSPILSCDHNHGEDIIDFSYKAFVEVVCPGGMTRLVLTTCHLREKIFEMPII